MPLLFLSDKVSTLSHLPTRSENKCLNCDNGPLADRYCPKCGQENVEPRQSLWHLTLHFFNDFWHFEGSFFRTIKKLLSRPGQLSKEYIAGRRKTFLDPIRLYIFISAVSLFYLLSVIDYAEYVNIRQHPNIAHTVDSIRSSIRNDTSYYLDFVNVDNHEVLILSLPPSMRHGWDHYQASHKAHLSSIKAFFVRRVIDMYDAYETNPYNFLPAAIDKFLHSFSRIFFVSLPFFVFFLWLLNYRHRKELLPYDHSIFTLHFYCFGFLMLVTLVTISDKLENFSFSDTLDTILFWSGLTGLFIYLSIAMKTFYGRSWIKTLTKSILLLGLSGFLMLILVGGFFLNSFLTAH